MSSLKWVYSCDLDKLAENMINEIGKDGSRDLFDSEIILVQSKGMQRYLSYRMAETMGISINNTFKFPRKFIADVFLSVLPEGKNIQTEDKLSMAFAIMSLLPKLSEKNEFESVRNYLGRGDDDLKLYQISNLIADLFDQYFIFRPDMVMEWQKDVMSFPDDADEKWQSILLREVMRILPAEIAGNNFAELRAKFKNALQEGKLNTELIPKRISVFGISYMPFEFLNILNHIPGDTQVTIYQMNPCRKYWGHIKKNRRNLPVSTDLHYEEGNRLLASLGSSARDWIDYLIDECSMDIDLDGYEHRIERDSLLHCIQDDIYTLDEEIGSAERAGIMDGSISIQCCHSAMRETEVLKNHIIDMLEKDATLMPEDILVMIPDIENYSPIIDAVFGVSADIMNSDGKTRPFKIPYNISDKTIHKSSPATELLLNIIKLRNERFSAGAVLNILKSPVLNSDISFSEDEIELIQKWMEDTSVRWGYDADEKSISGFQADIQNTWQAAIDRLMLSYASGGDDRSYFENKNILSYSGISTGDGITLGKMTEALERLNYTVKELSQSRSLMEWEIFISSLITSFIIENRETSEQILFFNSLMNKLARTDENSIFTGRVSIDVIEEYLLKEISNENSQYSFMKGGVTFCGTLPMRSIPFRMICMIGMNNDVFPGKQYQPGFDLMSREFRPGDRSRKLDDRYLFLEALMSAREKLYISFTGKGIKDDSDIPPSAIVNELIDYIVQNYAKNSAEEIVTTHKMQAFSSCYFDNSNSRLFSYSVSDKRIASSLSGLRQEYPALCPAPLDIRDNEEIIKITLDDLIRFIKNPSKHFVNKRLAIYLNENEGEPEDSECFKIDSLLDYQLKDEVLKEFLEAENNQMPDLSSGFRVSKSLGVLPHGNYGASCFENTYKTAVEFAGEVKDKLGKKEEILSFTLSFGNIEVECTYDDIYEGLIKGFRPADIKNKDRLCMVIRLAALTYYMKEIKQSISENDFLCGIIYGTSPKMEEYKFRASDSDYIKTLAGYYMEGLKAPLPFFPDTSMEYAGRVKKGMLPDLAALKAGDIWNAEKYPEKADKYFDFCFGKSGPFVAGFAQTAVSLYSAVFDSKVPSNRGRKNED